MITGGNVVEKNIKQKIDLTVEWLKKQVENSHTKGLVVGISGGIDSALVAFLIQKAFPNSSLGIIMPCKSDPKDKADALAVADTCGIKHMELELTEAHDLLYHHVLQSMESQEITYDQNHLRLSDANLRARLRMSSLYCIANALNYLVVGTDNAAEVYTGYFTKYGDGGVDILPIANLKKGEVYEWSAYLGVPQSVLDRPPSAGLWEGQTDENEMGTTYTMVDRLLDGEDIPLKDKEIIEKLHQRSEHKRRMPQAPPVF